MLTIMEFLPLFLYSLSISNESSSDALALPLFK